MSGKGGRNSRLDLLYAGAPGTVGQLIRVGPLRLLAKMPMSGTLFQQETLSQTLYVPSSVLEAGDITMNKTWTLTL